MTYSLPTPCQVRTISVSIRLDLVRSWYGLDRELNMSGNG